jgi:hypothetical protein
MQYLRHTSTVATIPQISESTSPTVVESYGDFQPPMNFRRTVETLLQYVPPKYLVGLKTIVLTNQAGLTSKKRKQRTWSRNRKVRLAECLGSYHRASKSSPATIWLYVDNIVESGISWWNRVPVLRYVVVSHVLYHEIGHHIHAVHRPVYEEKEDVADDWSGMLTRRFYSKHYWYLYPLLRILARLTSPIFDRLQKPI